MRGSCLLCLFALLVGQSPRAWAHSFKPERELTVQLDGEGVAALWSLEVGGPQASVLFATGDLDHDGELQPAEKVTLTLAMLSKAVFGVILTWDDAPLKRGELRPRLDVSGRVLLARGLSTLEVNGQRPPCGDHRLRVELEPRAGPLAVDVRALSGWRLDALALPADEPPRLPVVLAPGEHLEVRVSGSCTPAPSP